MIEGLQGDQLAYRTFLRELGVTLETFVRRRLARAGRGDSEAEDIVQETLLAIHSRRHTYDQSLPVTAWAHAIARYKVIDFLRAHAAAREDVRLEDIADAPSPGAGQREDALTVKRLLAALPERLRAAVTLTKVDGLSVAETAARTGMSQAAVKTNVHRGMKWIARMITGANR
jgi:RNA polymerase sigma-70 factor (ECF subfamily)